MEYYGSVVNAHEHVDFHSLSRAGRNIMQVISYAHVHAKVEKMEGDL